MKISNLEQAQELQLHINYHRRFYQDGIELKIYLQEVKKLKEKIEENGCGTKRIIDGKPSECGKDPYCLNVLYICYKCREAINILNEVLQE